MLVASLLEKEKGIKAGDAFRIFERNGMRFKIVICTDFRYQESIHREDINFLVWVTHFSAENYGRAVSEMRRFSMRERIQVMASSPVCGKNIGMSTYVNGNDVFSLSSYEGIMEIEINS